MSAKTVPRTSPHLRGFTHARALTVEPGSCGDQVHVPVMKLVKPPVEGAGSRRARSSTMSATAAAWSQVTATTLDGLVAAIVR
jgi:hypothetical protein